MNLMGQYFVFLDVILLPVAPEKIEISTPNLNKTVNLVDFSEVNILKGKGLKEISFEMLIPSFKYPFTNYSLGSMSTSQILARLEHLKEEAKPFQFIVTRCRAGKPAWWTNVKVSLEDFTIIEDANNGTDVVVSISLKEYKTYSTKVAKITEKEDGSVVATFDNPRNVVSGKIAPTLKLEESVIGGVRTTKGVINATKTVYNYLKVGFGRTDASLWNKFKSLNPTVKNIIEKETKVNLPNG